MSIEDREKFIDEFRKNYNAQAGKLSVEQADRLDIELKDRGNFGKFKRPAHGFGPHRSQAAPGECGHMPHTRAPLRVLGRSNSCPRASYVVPRSTYAEFCFIETRRENFRILA